jgi:shikimate kinase
VTCRLALIGAAGSGKSAVAGEVGQRWGAWVRDTDADFEAQHGRPVAAAVVDDEESFRARETLIVLDALAAEGAVVAVGSGAVVDPRVAQALADVPTVWLRVGLADAARRTGLSAARPAALGNVRAQLHAMLKERDALYAELADMTVATDAIGIEEVVARIEEWERQR